MTPVKNYIEFEDGRTMIYIQACDHDWANISVYKDRGGKCRVGCYHVSIPDLERNQYEPDAKQMVKYEEFDALLDTHRGAVLALVAYLNAEASG